MSRWGSFFFLWAELSMLRWPAISLGTSSMDDSARIRVRVNDSHAIDSFLLQVMSFMGRSTARRNYGRTREAVASVARERIEILVDQAKEMARKNENLSRRYVDLAWRISKRTKTRIPSEVKRYLCKGCGIALVPGHNARVRLYAHNTGVVITCLSCGSVRRYPVNRKSGSKKVLRSMKPYIAQTLPFPKKNSSKE